MLNKFDGNNTFSPFEFESSFTQTLVVWALMFLNYLVLNSESNFFRRS